MLLGHTYALLLSVLRARPGNLLQSRAPYDSVSSCLISRTMLTCTIQFIRYRPVRNVIPPCQNAHLIRTACSLAFSHVRLSRNLHLLSTRGGRHNYDSAGELCWGPRKAYSRIYSHAFQSVDAG